MATRRTPMFYLFIYTPNFSKLQFTWPLVLTENVCLDIDHEMLLYLLYMYQKIVPRKFTWNNAYTIHVMQTKIIHTPKTHANKVILTLGYFFCIALCTNTVAAQN